MRLIDVPVPVPGPTEVLVATRRSVVSPGTERAVRALASASLLGKARARPDLVRAVVHKARQQGVVDTVRSVRARLDENMTLGYAGCGVVVEVGAAVAGIRPGMRVATAGAAHGEYQIVAGLLCVPVPDEVDDDSAAFTTLGAVALHGLRQADVGPGGCIAIIGLGLVGQLTARLAVASGLRVVGIDTRSDAVERAASSSAGVMALVEAGADTTEKALAFSRGRGVDAVVITAATPSSAPARRAVDLVRDRGTVVVVGDIGLELERGPLYDREVTLRLARSYGPGRYEASYEQLGVDLPVGMVRFTAGRNMESVLDLMASGRLVVSDLVTHRMPVGDVADAYEAIASPEAAAVGVLLTYEGPATVGPGDRRRHVSKLRPVATPGVALLGAGTFARRTVVPLLRQAGLDHLVSVVSPSGTTARLLAHREGFLRAGSDAGEEVNAADVDLVAVVSRHDSHAELAVAALRAGKHVYCEKPLGLDHDELDLIEQEMDAHPECLLLVGHNRRWSPAIDAAHAALGSSGGPLVMTYRVSAGRLAASHWYRDRRQGGRLVGEVGHFVDTVAALAGGPPVRWWSTGESSTETALRDNLVVMVEFADGSSAVISYAADGHPTTPKERLEILGRGHTIVVDDFASVTVDGKRVWHGARDKGHARQFAELAAALSGRPSAPFLRLMRERTGLVISRIVVDCAMSSGPATPDPTP